jgi:hypothetical protein
MPCALVAAATDTTRAKVHRLADDESNRQRDPADDESRGQGEYDIKSESYDRAPDPERECSNEGGMGIRRNLRLKFVRTLRAGLSAIDLKYRPVKGRLHAAQVIVGVFGANSAVANCGTPLLVSSMRLL